MLLILLLLVDGQIYEIADVAADAEVDDDAEIPDVAADADGDADDVADGMLMMLLTPTTTRIAPAPADFVSRVMLSPIIVPYTYLTIIFDKIKLCWQKFLGRSIITPCSAPTHQDDFPKLDQSERSTPDTCQRSYC